MTARDFAFWLQGFFELANSTELTQEQVSMIKRHLNLVFIHDIDPSMGDLDHQEKLNAIHHPPEAILLQDADSVCSTSPGPDYVLGLHGWYDPKEGIPRC